MKTKYICCQPDDGYFKWQVHLWLESLKERGEINNAVVLILTPGGREFNTSWKDVEKLYPEAEFRYYKDEKRELNPLISIYIPVLRPYLLMRYFKEFPENENNAIFYCDADIIFTEKFNISHLIDNDISYLSDTKSYISAKYFDSKIKDVLPDKKEEYEKVDVLNEACSLVGINREIAEKNVDSSGGAQYLLKNVNWQFWEKVKNDCIKIRVYLQSVNKKYFENESKGFQSWCADMFAVLWNLWLLDKKTEIHSDLNFAWSSDNIKRLSEVGILHNAGITGKTMKVGNIEIPVFFKGLYHTGKDPFADTHIFKVFEDEKSKSLCNWYYVSKLIQIKQKYNINY